MSSHPPLSLADIDAFDPHGPPGRKWCPLCGNDKPKDAAHRSLSLDRTQGVWKCHRCGAAGRTVEATPRASLPRGLEGAFTLFPHRPAASRQAMTDVWESTTDVRESTTDGGDSFTASPEPTTDVGFDWRGVWDAAAGVGGTRGAVYLGKRGGGEAETEHAGVRFTSGWRSGASVLFPLVNRQGEVVAVQGRAVRGNAKITYGPKKEGVFLAPAVLGEGVVCSPFARDARVIVLTEAPIDALSLAGCGVPAVALCGTSGPSWLHLACGLRRVALAFDADDAGERAATEHIARLSPYGARCERLRPEGAKDWNDMLLQLGRESLREWLALRLI